MQTKLVSDTPSAPEKVLLVIKTPSGISVEYKESKRSWCSSLKSLARHRCRLTFKNAQAKPELREAFVKKYIKTVSVDIPKLKGKIDIGYDDSHDIANAEVGAYALTTSLEPKKEFTEALQSKRLTQKDIKAARRDFRHLAKISFLPPAFESKEIRSQEDFEAILEHELRHVFDIRMGLFNKLLSQSHMHGDPFEEPLVELPAYNAQLEFMLGHRTNAHLFQKMEWQGEFVQRRMRQILADRFMNIPSLERVASDLRGWADIRMEIASQTPMFAIATKIASVNSDVYLSYLNSKPELVIKTNNGATALRGQYQNAPASRQSPLKALGVTLRSAT